MLNTEEIKRLVENHRPELIQAADRIWEFAEERFSEFRSCSLQMDILKNHGFAVSSPCSTLPTAFMARYGSGHPVIGFLGEYDALPGLFWPADSIHPPTEESASTGAKSCGHGCGHNLLGTGALGAALAAKDYMDLKKTGGTIIYYGCPAEENAAGKAFMIEAGFFEGTDICLSWHPHFKSGLFNDALANCRVSYRFQGTSAHAAQSPHIGRSALDACELMNVGVNYLREHMIDEARVHYAYLNSGGTAPNIIPAEAEVFYAIRAPRTEQAVALKERVNNIARGAALMTDTTVEIDEKCIYESFLPNQTLDDLVLKYLDRFLPLSYTDEEMCYAARFVPFGNLPDTPDPIDTVPDFSLHRKTSISTDAGNVSQRIPSSAFMVNCYANGSPLHHWSVTAQGRSSIAHKGMLAAAGILASCACEILLYPSVAVQARQELLRLQDKKRDEKT